jgi:hypothetical protein
VDLIPQKNVFANRCGVEVEGCVVDIVYRWHDDKRAIKKVKCYVFMGHLEPKIQYFDSE